MVVRIPAFWDSSAIVPLCVDEPESGAARRLLRQFSQIVWWASLVEVRGSFARMNRFGTISSTDLRRASDQLSSLQRGWHQILPIDELRDRAADLIDTYPLRSADALQLAAALTWCQKRPVRRTFITADIRLAEAATLAGFTVVTP